jgi:hypothetical protein
MYVDIFFISSSDMPMQNLYKQLQQASRQWHDLQNRMQSGLGHQHGNEPFKDGSMAIFCPACPQPGINLPVDWQDRYTSYVTIALFPPLWLM